MMSIKISALLLFGIAFLNSCTSRPNNKGKEIELKKGCFFDDQNRRVVDTLADKVATVSTDNVYFILTIEDNKYLACNIPDNYNGKTIIVSAQILEIFDLERVVATPIRLTAASEFKD
ncbi:hypothetical protein [Foetidibacter luteolus]|uniref:hypothetical protein n=1 Tax=Foetidibacter luteolus TaxID=2608880 RepID=UPI00129B3408|nr:hypothetical protein [Foetidibacter luteolus]